jgi:omega-amidase
MKSRDITIAAVQTSLYWEDREANLKMFSLLLDAATGQEDVFVLPEMFTTGFSMKPQLFAEPMEARTLDWMRTHAAQHNAVITGSFIVQEDGRYFNRLMWVRPDGSYAFYSKRHLFTMGGEDKHYAPGLGKIIVDLHGWKICPLICYDLRFPVWSRNRWMANGDLLTADYEVLLYVANWPEVRAHAWKTLLMARAIENLSYVVGVNRVGNDGNFIYHSGDSALLDFRGEPIKTAVIGSQEIISSHLSYQLLQEFRKAFPAGRDADQFTI